MKVLIINTSDIHGGAAVAAFRLMQALNQKGVDAKMMVRDAFSNDTHVVPIAKSLCNKWNFYWERGKIFINNRFSKKNLFDISIANTGNSITHHPAFQEADVIHLHWINQGMLSVTELQRIVASGKKVVWTMHDMWPFTGVCHHATTCTHYETGCGNCPYLVAPHKNDISKTVFEQKREAYRQGKITFVACSHWLKDVAEKSPLTASHTVVSIPNPIDTHLYSPQDKTQIRNELNLPLDKKIILFAAVKASDKRKGMDYLIEAAQYMKKQTENCMFLIAGNEGEKIATQLPFPSKTLGYVGADKMPKIYNAADLFVTPSLQENLPNTIMEAMSCGTPCVGFRIGGIPEMIEHQKTGYVATYKDASDLAKGLIYTLFESDNKQLSINARAKVISSYEEGIIAEKYLKIYG